MKHHQQEIATPKVCKRKSARSATLILVYLATLVAISLALKMLSNSFSVVVPGSSKLSINYVSWFLSAIVGGPLGGAAVAGLTDVLGQLIIPTGGAPIPTLTVGNMAATYAFGMTFKYLPVKNSGARMIAGAFAFAIVGTLGINTFGLWHAIYRDTLYHVFFLSRLSQLIMMGLNLIILAVVLPTIYQMKLVDIVPKLAKEIRLEKKRKKNEPADKAAETE